MTIEIKNLEMDIAYACNLKCRGCTHYSNYPIGGYVEFETGKTWLESWAKRIKPEVFSLLGGEPMLNPRVCDYIRLVAELWPDSKRALITNGFFLDRAPELMDTLADTGTEIIVSLHSNAQDYQREVHLQLLNLASCPRREKVKLSLRNSVPFYSTYIGEGVDMRPYSDGNPDKSWMVCHNRECHTIHHGLLWKCPPIAFLSMVLERFGLEDNEQWKPYLLYRGVSADLDDDALSEYIGRKAEYICGMCPSKLEYHTALPESV